MGHLNSLLHPPLAINPSTFSHPYLLLVCLPHSFFFSLFVLPPKGRAQSDKVTDRHFSCHFFLPFLSDSLWLGDTRVADWQGAWRCMCVQTGLGGGGVRLVQKWWCVSVWMLCGVMMVCVSLGGGVRQGGALIGWESWGEEVWGSREEGWGCWVWRRSAVHLPSHTHCDSLEVSHLAAPRCLSARLYRFPMWKCALTVLTVLFWPLGIIAVRTRAKTTLTAGPGSADTRRAAPQRSSLWFECSPEDLFVVFFISFAFFNSVKYCDKVTRN